MVALSSPTFWRDMTTQIGLPQKDSGLDYVVVDHTTDMNVIVRTSKELFSNTVSSHLAGMHVIVNGNYFGLTKSGYIDVALGHDPVSASDTEIQGRVVSGGAIMAGDSRPQLFWFGQLVIPSTSRFFWTFGAGAGDPPLGGGTMAAIGGVGPLIINGLKYGNGNLYGPGVPAGAPGTGAPSAAAAPFLVQRNNATFISVESRPLGTGKTIFASHSANRMLLVGVQANGTLPGMSYTTLRDRLASLGFDHAVFLDGSDSSFMIVGGRRLSTPGEDKDEAMVVGVGFRWRK